MTRAELAHAAGVCPRCNAPADSAASCQACHDRGIARRRRYQIDHQARGLCQQCPRKALYRRSLCQLHDADARIGRQALYLARAAAGLCPACPTGSPQPGSRLCPACQAKARDRARALGVKPWAPGSRGRPPHRPALDSRTASALTPPPAPATPSSILKLGANP